MAQAKLTSTIVTMFVAMFVTLGLVGLVNPAWGQNLIVNGDFEDTTGWGPINTYDLPAGWEPPGDYLNPAQKQTGENAIGGSGTSAYLPAQASYGAMWQWFDPETPACWEFEMDFAVEDPGAGEYNRSLNFRLTHVPDYPGQGYYRMELRDMDDDGRGELMLHGDPDSEGGFGCPPGLENAIIFDDNVEVDPLVHHLKVIAHYEIEEPFFDMVLTNSDGEVFTSEGVQWWAGEAPLQDKGIEYIYFGCRNETGDFLVDNLSLVEGEPLPDKIPGDANEDGKVTDADAAILATNWQQCDVGWGEGDFNADGCVTDADAAILATHWQEGAGEAAAPVPEPSSVALLGAVLLVFVICRRRSN